MKNPSKWPIGFSRRDFVKALAGGVVYGGLSRFARALPDPAYPFEEIPPSVSGITWKHTAGKSPEHYLPETTGAGCAFLDYNNDGWMDIYLVNSGKCDFYNPNPPLRNALYRNNRDGTFTDVTVAAPGWCSSAVWLDYDNDGRLDLFVCQFVEFSKSISKDCRSGEDAKRGYCIPHVYKPTASRLFHNNGDGTFTDVSKASGIGKYLGKAWGAVATDLNNDGRMDLFVANDTVANFLFMNRGAGRFEEIGEPAGVAYSTEGRPRSGMGVDSADFNQDGWMDLFVANIDMERYAIYQNNHDETFDDVAGRTGIGQATRLMSGWGLKFFDYDNDGELDLFLGNGNPDDLIESLHPQVMYREPLMLFHNTGKNFQNVSAQSGPVFSKPLSSRGLAIGDFNNDGAVDVLVSVNDDAPVLLRNNVGSQNHWLGLTLVGRKSNRDAVGARITYQAGDLKRSRMKVGGGSYLSSHDPRIVLGIGQRKKLDWVEVKWPPPSGAVERFTDLAIDRYITIVEGEGKWK